MGSLLKIVLSLAGVVSVVASSSNLAPPHLPLTGDALAPAWRAHFNNKSITRVTLIAHDPYPHLAITLKPTPSPGTDDSPETMFFQALNNGSYALKWTKYNTDMCFAVGSGGRAPNVSAFGLTCAPAGECTLRGSTLDEAVAWKHTVPDKSQFLDCSKDGTMVAVGSRGAAAATWIYATHSGDIVYKRTPFCGSGACVVRNLMYTDRNGHQSQVEYVRRFLAVDEFTVTVVNISAHRVIQSWANMSDIDFAGVSFDSSLGWVAILNHTARNSSLRHYVLSHDSREPNTGYEYKMHADIAKDCLADDYSRDLIHDTFVPGSSPLVPDGVLTFCLDNLGAPKESSITQWSLKTHQAVKTWKFGEPSPVPMLIDYPVMLFSSRADREIFAPPLAFTSDISQKEPQPLDIPPTTPSTSSTPTSTSSTNYEGALAAHLSKSLAVSVSTAGSSQLLVFRV